MTFSTRDIVGPCFDFLTFELGFEVTVAKSSPYFDNAVIIFQRPDLLLRFSRDRGYLYIEVGPNELAEQWIDLNLLRNIMLGLRLDTDAGDTEFATFLQTQFSAIQTCFTNAQIDVTLKIVEAAAYERLKLMFPGAVEKKKS